ncbi:triose-phosphate isomerase [Mycoplasma zalophi]|uniref:Triosephosphate isomerase n=1 Tax=Mycoplasma zalophi TaxID=191287 RepID=A0ABS6DQL2_9MOLU|nr:triose-phosphate isomerase family protein [Mycoplasma zalophi]MBU4691313.1 triose-phosphate isomerase [Mycoplasma zalophi]MBU4692481.1 triose-phosphate isomerase [Mycoplasma zalophi]
MDKYYLIGNHKMNLTFSEEQKFVKNFNELSKENINSNIYVGISVSPSNLALKNVMDLNELKLGSQNISIYEKGAYTGEVSATQVKDLSVDFTILGHSERRIHFQDNPSLINTRIKNALKNDLNVILCIGETKEEYQENKTIESLTYQIEEALKDIQNPEKIIISYEPIWSIGTGLVSSNEHLKEIYDFLEKKLPHTTFMYGGSAKPSNILHLLEIKQIKGFLVGNASLDPTSFFEMYKILSNLGK